jgi:tripartite ATP-independent transporter DctP family solute receptor
MSRVSCFRKLSLVVLVLALSFVVASPGAQCKDKPVTLIFGGTMPTDDAATEAMYRLADIAAKKSGGSLKINIFPASQLGDAVSQTQAVSMGSQDMLVESCSYLRSKAPEIGICSYFFIFNSSQHYSKFTKSDLFKQWVQKYLDGTGVRTLTSNWVRLPRIMTANTPIKSVQDMKKLKVRVPTIGRSMSDSYKALGASPTPIAYGEVYLALAQGVINAADAPVDNMYTMKLYEPTKRIIITNQVWDSMSVWINDKKFQSLSAQQQRALSAAANEAGVWYSKKLNGTSKDYIAKMKAAGAEIVKLDLKPFKKLVAGKIKELEASGDLPNGLYDKIQAMDR